MNFLYSLIAAVALFPAVLSAAPVTTGTAGGDEDVQESAKLSPELIYRMAFLEQRKSSAYHNDQEHRDWVDQVYLSLKMQRSFDYSHEVVLEPAIRTVRDSPDDIEVIFDQAYLSLRLTSWLGLITGKKVEYTGSGFITNPSDLLFEAKDVFDVLYQREGRFLTKLVANYSRGTVAVGVLPIRTRDFGEGYFLFQATSDLLGADSVLTVTAQREEKATTGLSVSRFLGSRLELHFDGRYQSRQRSVITDNKNLREVPFNDIEPTEGAGVYLAGTRLVLSRKRSFILEGLVNEPGLDPDQLKAFYTSERFTDAAQTTRRRGEDVRTPDARLIGRNYAFTSYIDEQTLAATRLAASALVNLDDNSLFATLQWQRAFSEITSIELTPTFFRGPFQSEFGESPFQTSIYLSFKGQF